MCTYVPTNSWRNGRRSLAIQSQVETAWFIRLHILGIGGWGRRSRYSHTPYARRRWLPYEARPKFLLPPLLPGCMR